MLRLVPLADVRTDLGFRELANALAQQLLIGAQAEVHVAARLDHHGQETK